MASRYNLIAISKNSSKSKSTWTFLSHSNCQIHMIFAHIQLLATSLLLYLTTHSDFLFDLISQDLKLFGIIDCHCLVCV